jgi:hypothetical protein
MASKQLLDVLEECPFSPLASPMILFPKGFKNIAFYNFFHAYLLVFGNMEL